MQAYRIKLEPYDGSVSPGDAYIILPYPGRASAKRELMADYDIGGAMCVLYFDCKQTIYGPLALDDSADCILLEDELAWGEPSGIWDSPPGSASITEEESKDFLTGDWKDKVMGMVLDIGNRGLNFKERSEALNEVIQFILRRK